MAIIFSWVASGNFLCSVSEDRELLSLFFELVKLYNWLLEMLLSLELKLCLHSSTKIQKRDETFWKLYNKTECAALP